MTPRWRIFSRGRYLGSPSTFLGVTAAATKTEALSDARLRHPNKIVEVVSDLAWQAMSDKERTIFNGTFEPPTDDPHPNIRRSKCIECGAEILYGRDHAGKWRSPPIRCKGPGCERKPRRAGCSLT